MTSGNRMYISLRGESALILYAWYRLMEYNRRMCTGNCQFICTIVKHGVFIHFADNISRCCVARMGTR
jgi:hypothetical protein